MKLSFTTMATPGKSAAETVRLAGEYGYEGVDIRVSDHLGELKLNSTGREIGEVRDIFVSANIKPSGLLCYNSTGSNEADSFKKMTESILRHLEIAEALGTPSIRIFGGNPGGSSDPGLYTARTAEAIAKALQKNSSNILVLIQNHVGGYSVKEILDLIKLTGDSRFGLVFSPDNCILMNEDFSGLYSEIRSAARQLYIADLIPVENDFIDVLPGKGIVPWKKALEILNGRLFDGWITFKWEKIWHSEIEEPETALPYFIEHIKALDI